MAVVHINAAATTLLRISMIILSPRTLQLPRLVSVLLKSAQKLHEVLLFLRCQFCAANHVEEFHGVFQGQESPVVHVRRRGLDPAERERFDGSIRAGHHAVNHLRFIKALRLKVVHQVIGEIRSALLELSKIFNGLESTLGPEETLDVHASERRSLDAMSELLWANVTDFMGGAICAAIRVAVEAGYAEAWFFGSTIFGCVELLLRKRREQEA